MRALVNVSQRISLALHLVFELSEKPRVHRHELLQVGKECTRCLGPQRKGGRGVRQLQKADNQINSTPTESPGQLIAGKEDTMHANKAHKMMTHL